MAMLFFPDNTAARDGDSAACYGGDALGVELMLSGMDALVQGFSGIIVQNRNRLLADDWAGVYTGIYEMNGAARNLNTVVQRLLPGFKAGKRGQKGRMNIHDAALECAKKIALENAHKTGKNDQVYFGGLQCCDKCPLGIFVELGAEFARRNELGWEFSFAGV